MIQFTVPGLPQPAGSKKGFPIRRANGALGVAITDANPKSRDWKNAVASEARARLGESFGLLDGPLQLTVEFVLPRPKGHYGKGGLNKNGRDNPYPTKKPDATKLLRCVEDALTGVAWRDDAQIVAQIVTKVYGEPARAEVTIRQLEATT